MLSELSNIIDSCARTFRCGREAEAAVILQQVIAGLCEIMEKHPAAFSVKVEQAIAMSLSYQQAHDWIALADELQFVLKPEIESRLG